MLDLRVLKWFSTALQLSGALALALHLPFSGWAYPVMLAGAIGWVWVAYRQKEGALLTLNLSFAVINMIGIWRWLI